MIKIDTAVIPENEIRFLAMTLLDGAKKFYENPENVAAFKEWQKKRNQLTA